MEREFIRKILHHGRRGRRHHSLATTLSRELPHIALCVCFFVLCNRHWFNRVPGANLGIVCLPSALTLTLAVPTYP